MPLNEDALKDFAARYTAAWCSQDAESVAACFEADGSISVNGNLSDGRIAIAEMVSGFMTAFPDLELTMDRLDTQPAQVRYHWTFRGTNTGPGGTGKSVRFSGYEEWTISDNGIIQVSLGHFDAEDYQRQLQG